MSLFLDALRAGGVHVGVPAADKPTFIRNAVGLLDLPPKVDRERAARSIIKREELGSTGIGRGIATPHSKIPDLDRIMMAAFVPSEPIDFESLDGEPVSLLFMILSPVDKPGDHLRLLEVLSRALRDEMLRRFWTQAKTKDEFWQITEEWFGGGFES